MKYLVLIIIIAIMAFTLAACGAPEPAQTPSPSPTPEVTPTPTPTPVPTVEATPTPEPVSHTTGLPFTGEYKPVMVVIENSGKARPQLGLQTADVVYEVPVEGSVTRFVCVFSDNIPEEVMPVRSGREVFLHLQHEWDAVFMHFGGSGTTNGVHYTFYGNELYSKIKIDVDGLKGKWNDYYDRVKGIKVPHNVKMYPQLAQQLYDYSPAPLGWLFDSEVSYQADAVSEIELAMCSNDSNFVSYTYDAEKDAYLRSMNGKAFKSKETGEQVSVKNIIVQYSTYTRADVYKVWKMVGEGNADIHIGGKLIKGTWKKETEDSRTVFYDPSGNQIVLKPGNTWVHISPQK